ncbi:DUF1499 domain-containing protein [Actibacterium sp. MT2.3-13A]|uniref:DUF1499 domain-containing protein n=1 Tax=Actibacterium sp. MT2.3-13A TaxID=2828332 RepID=UPI001BADD937|nr:DUF1499 domain-containing protein [Actibacterium sp. MT2.3-13A]
MKARLRQFLFSTLTLLALIAVSGALYIRVAPMDVAEVHRTYPGHGPGDWPMPGGFEAVRAVGGDPQAALARLDAIILATPRTRALAGAVAEGHVSYVTRSAVWGFPDTTNVWLEGALLHIRGHLRFGGSDLGVNRRRIEGWLQALGQP